MQNMQVLSCFNKWWSACWCCAANLMLPVFKSGTFTGGVPRPLFFLVLLIITFQAPAQDVQFSQFYSAPMYLGPSMAGSANEGRLVMNYRDQWPRLSGRFVTYAVSYDQYVEKYNSGIGINFLHDNAGNSKLTSTMAGVSYSYRIKAGRNLFVQPGLQTYYFQRRIDFEKLTFADQFYGNQILPTSIQSPPEQNRGQVNFSTSVLVFNENLWVGAGVNHLLQLNTSLAEDPAYMPLRFISFGGITFNVPGQYRNRDDQSVSLAYQFRHQASVSQLDVGAYYFREPFGVGIWYRGMPSGDTPWNRDALVFSAGLRYEQFLFSYSYDMTISSMIQTTGGAHEIAVHYRFGKLISDLRGIGQVPCPRF